MHAPRVLEAFACEDDPPPVPLFVGITISGESRSGSFSAATHGLEALGHKEFEVISTRLGIGELRTTLMDLSLYVLRSGPVLKHGESFGPSADVIWSVRHASSRLVKGRDVIVLGSRSPHPLAKPKGPSRLARAAVPGRLLRCRRSSLPEGSGRTLTATVLRSFRIAASQILSWHGERPRERREMSGEHGEKMPGRRERPEAGRSRG